MQAAGQASEFSAGHRVLNGSKNSSCSGSGSNWRNGSSTAADLDSPPSIVIMHLAGLLLLRGKHSTAQHPAVRKQSLGSVQSVVPAVSNSQKTAQDAADA